MSKMARYTVKFVVGERRGSLLIVLPPTEPCSALVDAVKNRILTLKGYEDLTDLKDADATLHLEEADGPMLYLADTLCDVLPGAKETVVVVLQVQYINKPSQSQNDTLLAPAAGRSLKIRVISPELARSRDLDTIAPLSDALLLDCSLKELKARVQEHLGFPPDDGGCPELECNCKLARQIDNNATLNERGIGDLEASCTVIVVYGNNEVVAIPIAEATLSVLQQAARAHLGDRLRGKWMNAIGGVQDTSAQMAGDKHYLKVPVLAVCAPKRHDATGPRPLESVRVQQGVTEHRDLIVDLHTSECPIEITAHNSSITLAEARLEDCAINGVLNIFAVQRWTSAMTESPQGKAAIFKKSDAWEHPNGQSDRGISNLLSTLRVFAGLTAGGTMEDARQDAVLHLMHLLTRFPPAVRAAYVLMRGETPRLSERAALAQSLYEVLKAVVPLRVVQSDSKRLFEGSRLLFGLILEKAKNLKLSKVNDERSDLPYVSMRIFDMRNMITMDPVLSSPVQTKSGLVDLGFYKAFAEGGLLTWTNDNNTSKVSMFDDAWSRIAILSGGTKAQVVGFNVDTVSSSKRYADRGDISNVISSAEYSELSYLAGLCSRNQLNVVPPATLPSASPPVLTLDRVGSLAVYLGRAPCGEAGKDILLFRPTSSREEEGIDVSIITQVLEPILAQRTADGTGVFEAYGEQHRKLIAPDEITMLCVDLSSSMEDRCGFGDVQHNEDAATHISRSSRVGAQASSAPIGENPAFPLPDSDELKEYLKAHESFDDFLAIIRTGRDDYQRRLNAEKVLQIIQQIDEQQIEAKVKRLEELQRRASSYHYRTQANIIERELSTLRNRSLRLQKYKNLICAWFLASLGRSDLLPDPLTWTPGDAIPQVQKAPQKTANANPTFEIPREFCCHISSEVMEDPVVTVDDYTYERKNIERWFQTNEKSPLTNLVLPSLDLRPDVQKKEAITAFLSGSDITSKYKTLRRDSNLLRVSIKSPLDTWSLLLPRKLKLEELWELSFRLTKGRYVNFELQHRNARLPPSRDTIGSAINTDHTVFVTPSDPKIGSNGSDGTEELCLVKVYDGSYEQTIVSYWEPKKTTKSLGSVVFQYYRHKFAMKPTTLVENPFTLWTRLRYVGDNHFSGSVLDGPWEPLCNYFTHTFSTGVLAEESCIDKADDDDGSVQSALRLAVNGNQPLVFKVALGRPPASAKKRDNNLSRLDVLKQMFDAYINRILAYSFQTHIGLVTFGTKASVSQGITNAVENFRHKLNNMAAEGDTAIWDSIALAQDQLEDYAEKYPNARLRIICISDGEDNKSKQNVVDLTSKLWRRGILVDSFCLGDASNDDLKTVSYLTGGYAFEPNTLEEAMAICELEPVLSSLERPEAPAPDSEDEEESDCREMFRTHPSLLTFRQAAWEVEVEQVSRDVFPERKEHPQLAESFVELGNFSKYTPQTRTDTNLRLSRIHNEIRNSGAHPHPDYDVYICEPNMGLWKVVMQGPRESTYAGGTFLLYIEMGADYPMFAPTARFVTPIYHPNINRHGRICHSILDRNWTVDTSNKDLIDTIYSLLLVPEFSDPINTVVTLNYHWDEVQFKEEAQKHIQKHASKTRAVWRNEIVG